MKIKNFCSAKGTANEMKRQAANWEKMFANNIYVIIYSLCNRKLKLNKKKLINESKI